MMFSGSPSSMFVLALTALVLAGCGSIPYEVETPKSVQRQLELEREAAVVPQKRAISLCYSRAVNTPEELQSEAQLICGNGEAKFLESDTFWTPCSLSQPARATFICTPAPSASQAPAQ